MVRWEVRGDLMKKIEQKRKGRSKAVKIKLKKNEVKFLREFVEKGEKKARALRRANVLLLAHQKKKDGEITELLHVAGNTIWRTKKRYLEVGLPDCLEEKPRPGQPKKYKEKEEAEIIALACSAPPEGRKRWPIRLLAETLTKKKILETASRESVRLILKKRSQTLAKKDVVHSKNNS